MIILAQVLAAVAESNGVEDTSSSAEDDEVQLRKRLQPEGESSTQQRASEG